MKKYFDRIDQNWYEEKELRKFCFDYETQDLRNNLEDYTNDIYNIEGQCDILIDTLRGDIENVVDRLNTCWNYELVSEDKYYMDQYTYLSSKCGKLEEELKEVKKGIEQAQDNINRLEKENK